MFTIIEASLVKQTAFTTATDQPHYSLFTETVANTHDYNIITAGVKICDKC